MLIQMCEKSSFMLV